MNPKVDTNQEAANVARVVKLGDKTYIASPPDLEEFMSLQTYAREKLPTPLQALASDPGFHKLTAAQQNMYLEKIAALSAGGGATITEQGVVAALQTLEGTRFLAWIAFNKNHPGIKQEELAESITDANRRTVFIELIRAVGLTQGDVGN